MLGSVSMTTTVNSLRKNWVNIITVQVPNTPYDNCSIAANPICYTPPAPYVAPVTQGTWTDITLDGLVYGDDFAIASQPICGTPYPLPPIGNQPPVAWANINTTQTSNWVDIPT